MLQHTARHYVIIFNAVEQCTILHDNTLCTIFQYYTILHSTQLGTTWQAKSSPQHERLGRGSYKTRGRYYAKKEI